MIAHVTVGADDIKSAQRFYDSFLPALGYALDFYHGDLSYSLSRQAGESFALPEFYVKSPFNGDSATFGNGSMIVFEANNQEQVRRFYAAAVTAGGSDDGASGFRDAYGADFYSVICATRRVTRLLLSPATRMIRDATDDHPSRALNVICGSNQSCSCHQC